ncbi:SSI family serine proteinase inhibitor [Streptomyces indicus]|uniref:Subtilisin inhibitor-like n=1 Tax=Streptomyces indicus TaxID=417292 RepID=A0A1G8V806_9ACTN|nr:SSI family serine proteinase inhibitor [Streptomyces indicus]SDJ62222.1 Subtilisin inhibitor-like [Streptomyces indicus]
MTSSAHTATTTAVKGLLAAAAAGALLIGAAGAASAADHDTERRASGRALPGNWMYLGVMEGDGAFGDLQGRLLRCPPGKGNGHPHAGAACRTLAKAKGEIANIKPRDVACPMIYKPVTAVAYGMWDGTRRIYAKTFSNDCVMGAETGSVFKLAE